ncbi:hypothetical protein BP5796_08105 [Coleophoma crateriformis]|uniref:ABC transporter domain-containing protein n=1 Tax=Coleophoma crateriformis TaxID=565419 RepID=A0A3D8RDV4_9HELO|nr:hypothetical protein BP5796_08105 [Coleophoma crateriformis]
MSTQPGFRAASVEKDSRSSNSVVLPSNHNVDIEQGAADDAQLMNNIVQTLAWQRVTVTVKDRKTKLPKTILDCVDGIVEAGEVCALMGPSGCGKTTLLNMLSGREVPGEVGGEILLNGKSVSTTTFRRLSSYVEQEDVLVGSLTVRETLSFAARLAHTNKLTKRDRMRRIEGLLESFGLRGQSDHIIGTPIKKGISGGQKRRTSIASQLITGPKIMFLDEPTSGLDSAASYEVISFIKTMAKRCNLIIVASIHQPSTTTFELFDKLLLLSGGQTQYFGPVDHVGAHFESIGHPIPLRINPAEFLLDITNTDFATDDQASRDQLQQIRDGWIRSPLLTQTEGAIEQCIQHPKEIMVPALSSSNFFQILITLLHRSFIKSYRDFIAYGVRIAMYTGLAIMMGTVWLRLGTDQKYIVPFTNAIFFGSAFMSFMAVAYIPSFLEDRSTFIKERANGLYGSAVFMLSNFLIGLPYLFLIAIIFSCIAYWLGNFRPTGSAFMTWIMWLYLDLLAAESLVVFISSIFPIFVVSLALTAFANGLWMCVAGFLVTPEILNVFWKYVFHYIDYQSYVFQGMIVNEFKHRTFTCGADCNCMYQTELASECRISGQGVLNVYGYHTGNTGKWVGILLGIILGYRILGWASLAVRK